MLDTRMIDGTRAISARIPSLVPKKKKEHVVIDRRACLFFEVEESHDGGR
jgi:hypothetical protein